MKLFLIFTFCLFHHFTVIAQNKSHEISKNFSQEFKSDSKGEKGLRVKYFEVKEKDSMLIFTIDGIALEDIFSKMNRKQVYELLGRPDSYENGTLLYFLNADQQECYNKYRYRCPAPINQENFDEPNTVSQASINYGYNCELGTELGFNDFSKLEISFY